MQRPALGLPGRNMNSPLKRSTLLCAAQSDPATEAEGMLHQVLVFCHLLFGGASFFLYGAMTMAQPCGFDLASKHGDDIACDAWPSKTEIAILRGFQTIGNGPLGLHSPCYTSSKVGVNAILCRRYS